MGQIEESITVPPAAPRGWIVKDRLVAERSMWFRHLLLWIVYVRQRKMGNRIDPICRRLQSQMIDATL